MEKFPNTSSDKPEQDENKNETHYIKEGVDFVFKEYPELAQIGAKEQYCEYLDTVFPESKVRDIVYHGTRTKFDYFDLDKAGLSGRNYGKGVYATTELGLAQKYALDKHVLPIILNIKKPLITDQAFEDWYQCLPIPYNKKITDYIEYDAVLNYQGLDRELLEKINDHFIEYKGPKNEKGFPITYIDRDKNIYQISIQMKEIVVPDTQQAHILGTQKDLEKFQEFISKKTK